MEITEEKGDAAEGEIVCEAGGADGGKVESGQEGENEGAEEVKARIAS